MRHASGFCARIRALPKGLSREFSRKLQIKLSIQAKFTAAVLMLLFLRYICCAPTECADYIGLQYLLSYRYGFIARGLVGSILEPFRLYLTKFKLTCICLLVEMMLTAVYAFFVWGGVRRANGKNKVLVGCLFLILTMSPMSPAFTYAINNFGRFDAVHIMIAIMQCMLLMEPTAGRGFIACVLSAVGMLVHPQYIFGYFMVGALLLFYWVAQDGRHRKRWMALFALNAALVVGLFLVFTYVRPVGAGWTQETMFWSIQSRTNIDASGSFYQYLDDWYFGDVGSQMANNVWPFPMQKYTLALTVFFMLPYEAGCYWVWLKGMKEAGNIWRKLFFVAVMVSFAVTVPCFVIMIDYGRYCASFYFSQMLMLIYLLCIGDKGIEEKVHGGISFLRKNCPVFAAALVLWSVNLGYFKDIVSLDLSEKAYALLAYYFGVIQAVL